jgi:predicted transcriptional regulator
MNAHQLEEPLGSRYTEDTDPRLLAVEEAERGLRPKLFNVYNSLVLNGPCTTRRLATATGIDLLTLRPLATRLFQMGLIRRVGIEAKQGLYQAVINPEKLRFALTVL